MPALVAPNQARSGPRPVAVSSRYSLWGYRLRLSRGGGASALGDGERLTVAEEGPGQFQQLAHHRHDHDLGALASGAQPLGAADRADFERIVAAARETLSDPACRAAWAEGQTLPLERAIEEALADDASPAPPAAGGPLSPREVEVAALVAAGLSNREIAARLVITERTAEGHVVHILDRLGFRTRVQIAAWATERGLRQAGAEGGSGSPA